MYKICILRLKRDTNIYPKIDIIIIADVMNIQAIKNKVSKTTSIPLIDIYEITRQKNDNYIAVYLYVEFNNILSKYFYF